MTVGKDNKTVSKDNESDGKETNTVESSSTSQEQQMPAASLDVYQAQAARFKYMEETIQFVDNITEMTGRISRALDNKDFMASELCMKAFLFVLKKDMIELKEDILRKASRRLRDSFHIHEG